MKRLLLAASVLFFGHAAFAQETEVQYVDQDANGQMYTADGNLVPGTTGAVQGNNTDTSCPLDLSQQGALNNQNFRREQVNQQQQLPVPQH